jgi:hypothetical protein
MYKKLLFSIVAVFGFINIAMAKTNQDSTPKLTPIYYFYGDPCRHYDFRLRHPERCDAFYDEGETLFPFFGINRFIDRHIDKGIRHKKHHYRDNYKRHQRKEGRRKR